LVPLADMLTNTVGIMVFILIFTVLATGGVMLAKRLPLEHWTKSDPIFFLCIDERVIPLDVNLVPQKFLRPLGRPGTYDEVGSWLERFNARSIENDFFIVRGSGRAHYSGWSVSLNLTLVYSAKEGKGERAACIADSNSLYRRTLQRQSSDSSFVHFIVRPEAIDGLYKAREIALEMGYGVGWRPLGPEDSVGLSLTGGGRAATEL
jgi:hypothetical protein